jgi:tyrosine decarboxylase/aspartate 1-decarboxylase
MFAPGSGGGGALGDASLLSRRVFEAAEKRGLHLAVAELPAIFWGDPAVRMQHDRETMTCLRSVLMKPEHLDWVGDIWQLLAAAAEDSQGERCRSA